MSKWKSTGGRITVSLPPYLPLRIRHLTYTGKLRGEEPDSFQKPANPLMPSIAQGSRNGLRAGCLAQPARIDFNLTPSPPSQEEAQEHALFP